MKSMRPLRVLHFAGQPVRGGAEEHMLLLLQNLDRHKFRPLLAAPPKLLQLVRKDLPRDVDTFAVALGPGSIADALRFVRYLRTERVDMVHSHMFQSSLVASPLAWIARVPVVIETPHVRERWRTGWIKGGYVVDRMIARFVDSFIAVSIANGDYLRNVKGIPDAKITVIQNGTALDRFDPRRPESSALRESLGIDKNAQVVLVLGRLEPQKGHSVLLDAWTSVAQACRTAHLVCVGDGCLRSELEGKTASLGISSSVTFTGYRQDIPELLAMSSFTVLPSHFEGLPLAAIESLAAGRAVVATAVDGTVEVVIDGHTGRTVPPADSRSLAQAIIEMLNAPAVARALGTAGRQLVEQRFSETRQIAETETLYLRLWNQHAHRLHANGKMSEPIPRTPSGRDSAR